MGEGDQRRSRRTARFDSRELAILARKTTRTEAEWDQELATGTQPLSTTATVDSRTQTVDDPLTTSLLAEVARRSTIDVAPDPADPRESICAGDPGDPGDAIDERSESGGTHRSASGEGACPRSIDIEARSLAADPTGHPI